MESPVVPGPSNAAEAAAGGSLGAAGAIPSSALPGIPAKRYFTIGEVSELCAVKPYVLRYWEQEFTQLKPMKRRGNRRYYQHHEVLLIRRIRDLLYDQGFTISGARNRLAGAGSAAAEAAHGTGETAAGPQALDATEAAPLDAQQLRSELLAIRELLAA